MPSAPSQTTPASGSLEQGAPKVRRFAPEPIETTVKSSKSARTQSPEKKEPPKVRRFTPQPIETTTKSSRGDSGAAREKPAPRRFAPQPIETSHKSSRDKSGEQRGHAASRFKPQLMETQHGGNRKTSRQTSTVSETTSDAPGARKFVPVVLSTASRSRRAGDRNVVSRKDMKTEEGHAVHARELQKHAGWKTPETEKSAELSPRSQDFSSDAKRPVAPLDGRPGPRFPAVQESRSHSFRCPDLDTIESSESERESSSRSRSVSPAQGSPITASDSSFNEYYKHATRIRESVDENFSQYFLRLEAQKAERRLQEAALAAFPNSDFHEPVQHYVNDDQDSLEDEIEDRPVTWEGFDEEEYLVRIRRDSTKVPWEQMEMQRHAERVEQERNANKTTAKKESSPWWNPVSPLEFHQTDNEMRSMRDRARPPMLGYDLVFARCPSPEPARFDVTQGSDKLRIQMLNQSQQASQSSPIAEPKGGLWAAAPKAKDSSSHSNAESKGEAKSKTGHGLWGGFCVGVQAAAENEPSAGGLLLPPPSQTGLMTPGARPETANPFEQSFAARNALPPPSSSGLPLTTPPTAPANNPDISRLDSILAAERAFEETFEREYPDSFIVQVYNYLSLGYPSLARPFDEELSKISRIPIAQLRQDDVKAKQNPRGYIRLDPAFEGVNGGEKEGCVRWQALKLYVREWARQEKNMVHVDAPGGNWATTNRRGSWAI